MLDLALRLGFPHKLLRESITDLLSLADKNSTTEDLASFRHGRIWAERRNATNVPHFYNCAFSALLHVLAHSPPGCSKRGVKLQRMHCRFAGRAEDAGPADLEQVAIECFRKMLWIFRERVRQRAPFSFSLSQVNLCNVSTFSRNLKHGFEVLRAGVSWAYLTWRRRFSQTLITLNVTLGVSVTNIVHDLKKHCVDGKCKCIDFGLVGTKIQVVVSRYSHPGSLKSNGAFLKIFRSLSRSKWINCSACVPFFKNLKSQLFAPGWAIYTCGSCLGALMVSFLRKSFVLFSFFVGHA